MGIAPSPAVASKAITVQDVDIAIFAAGDRQVRKRPRLIRKQQHTRRPQVEIAFRQLITINSVKSYIRSVYRKLGVTSRAKAVAWGLEHGFDPHDQSQRQPIADRSSA